MTRKVKMINMKNIIATIITVALIATSMFIYTVSAEASEVTEAISERFSVDYDYDCSRLDSAMNTETVMISLDDCAIICVEKGSRIMEMFFYDNAVDFANVATAVITMYADKDIQFIYVANGQTYTATGTDATIIDIQRNINLAAMASLINAGGKV